MGGGGGRVKIDGCWVNHSKQFGAQNIFENIPSKQNIMLLYSKII